MKLAIAIGVSTSLALSISTIAQAEEHKIEDGTYTARVKTDSGTYTVPVEVEDGEVSHVQWPNGGNMRVNGADIDEDEAVGHNEKGEQVTIEIEDPEYTDDE